MIPVDAHTSRVDLEHLRLAVYRGFATTGRAPQPEDLARQLHVEPWQVVAGLRALADQRHVVLDPSSRVAMAHPFAAIPLGFAVMGRDTLWWGGCAWDSFALPHLLPGQSPVLVATRCPACAAALAWNVEKDAPPTGDQVAHFLVPVAQIWDDVVHSCANQRLFCSPNCVDAWLTATGNRRGYVMDLSTLWRLGRDWYTGRLDHGYSRRDPAQAADYFRSVGLQGAFWGL